MKVLVVEDDQEKLRKVLTCLKDAELADTEIEISRDVVSAKRLLAEKSFDLLVLDISLPETPDALPTKDAGVRLLDEILNRDVYRRPREVVGLTAYDDVHAEAGAYFQENIWTVVKYDRTSDSWLDQMKRKVRHIRLAKTSGIEPTKYESFLGIVTALHDPELTAILDLPWEWSRFETPNDPSVYYKGKFTREGHERTVVAVAAPRMGMTASTIATMKLIETFRPRFVSMAGILAGIRGQCNLGDIVVADPSWDYGNGKQSTRDGVPVFKPAPHQISLDSFVRSKLVQMSQDQAIADEIRRSWKRKDANAILKMLVGPVASGSMVLEDAERTKEVQSQHRKLVGIEMETYGVFAASIDCTLPQPKAFSIKSVCDFGDAEKDDAGQAYAAYTSAQAVRIFSERFL